GPHPEGARRHRRRAGQRHPADPPPGGRDGRGPAPGADAWGGVRQPALPDGARPRPAPAAGGPSRRGPPGDAGRGVVTALAVAALLGVASWLALPGAPAPRPGQGLGHRDPDGRRAAGRDGSGQVTEAADLLALALGTGLPVEGSLREVAAALGGPGAAELR